MDGAADVDHGAARGHLTVMGLRCELGKECALDRNGGAVGGRQPKANGLSRENPHAMKSVIDHKSDCAPVSAIAETSSIVFEVRLGVPYLVWAEVSMEIVIGILGWSLRRARFHSPLVKM